MLSLVLSLAGSSSNSLVSSDDGGDDLDDDDGEEFDFLRRNSSLLFSLLLLWEGETFFLFSGVSTVFLSLVSRKKEVEAILKLKVN